MMLLKIHFNDDEIRHFFEANGFKVADHTTGHFRPAYHNRSEWVEYEVPGIVLNGRTYDATKVFEQVVEQRVKRMVAPANLETKRAIEQTIKRMKNGQ